MSSTSNSTQESETVLGEETVGGFGYGLGLSIAVLIVFVIVTYASYKCKQRSQSRLTTTSNHHSSADNGGASIITIQHNGLDEATISSYPQYTYSQLKPHKGDPASSACSICLADYKDSDTLRLLPECGHLFHGSCIDPWLRIHPTCPICRNSPFQISLAQPAPVATQ